MFLFIHYLYQFSNSVGLHINAKERERVNEQKRNSPYFIGDISSPIKIFQTTLDKYKKNIQDEPEVSGYYLPSESSNIINQIQYNKMGVNNIYTYSYTSIYSSQAYIQVSIFFLTADKIPTIADIQVNILRIFPQQKGLQNQKTPGPRSSYLLYL